MGVFEFKIIHYPSVWLQIKPIVVNNVTKPFRYIHGASLQSQIHIVEFFSLVIDDFVNVFADQMVLIKIGEQDFRLNIYIYIYLSRQISIGSILYD